MAALLTVADVARLASLGETAERHYPTEVEAVVAALEATR